jgi:hypothetical protein
MMTPKFDWTYWRCPDCDSIRPLAVSWYADDPKLPCCRRCCTPMKPVSQVEYLQLWVIGAELEDRYCYRP